MARWEQLFIPGLEPDEPSDLYEDDDPLICDCEECKAILEEEDCE